MIKNLYLCLLIVILRVRDCCECFVFKYCHNAHIPCTFADFFEKIDRCTNKKLEDSSNMVKSGYAAMIKLENELFNKFRYFFSQIFQNFKREKATRSPFLFQKLQKTKVVSRALARRGTCNMEPMNPTWDKC